MELITGDCLEVLRGRAEASVDAVVTDPPYGLGKEPDAAEVLRHWLAGDDYRASGGGFMGKSWDSFVPGPATWREVLRVLKPGGYALVFAGSRTQDLMSMALRLAGFEIRDCLMWLYGSGFPKSLNLGDGWGTALKPAYEPIILARKPLADTVAGNVLRFGTGALNIDGCRISLGADKPFSYPNGRGGRGWHGRESLGANLGVPLEGNPAGRWPANVLHDGSDEVLAMFPQAPGQLADASSSSSRKTQNAYGEMKRGNAANAQTARRDAGSAARFFYCAKASKADRNAGLDHLHEHTAGDCTGRQDGSAGLNSPRAGAGRTSGSRNSHPTVKPTELMRYLCRLIVPPGGTVLDPFMGSGSTGKAAALEGFRFIGVEQEPEYAAIARARVHHAQKEFLLS